MMSTTLLYALTMRQISMTNRQKIGEKKLKIKKFETELGRKWIAESIGNSLSPDQRGKKKKPSGCSLQVSNLRPPPC